MTDDAPKNESPKPKRAAQPRKRPGGSPSPKPAQVRVTKQRPMLSLEFLDDLINEQAHLMAGYRKQLDGMAQQLAQLQVRHESLQHNFGVLLPLIYSGLGVRYQVKLMHALEVLSGLEPDQHYLVEAATKWYQQLQHFLELHPKPPARSRVVKNPGVVS